MQHTVIRFLWVSAKFGTCTYIYHEFQAICLIICVYCITDDPTLYLQFLWIYFYSNKRIKGKYSSHSNINSNESTKFTEPLQYNTYPCLLTQIMIERVLICAKNQKYMRNIFLVKIYFGFYVLFILWVESKLVAELQFPGFKPQPLSPPGGAPPMALAKRIKFYLRSHFSGVHCDMFTH